MLGSILLMEFSAMSALCARASTTKRKGSRRSLFKSLDKPALRALPAERYEYGDWESHRVNKSSTDSTDPAL